MNTRDVYARIGAVVVGMILGRLLAEFVDDLLGGQRERQPWRLAARNADDLEEVRRLAHAHDEELVQVHEHLEGFDRNGRALSDRVERLVAEVATQKGWLGALAERIERYKDQQAGDDGAPESDAHAVTPEREREVI